MFKGAPLPDNCPPSVATEPTESLVLFRILPDQTVSENSFLTYRQLYPKNKRYINLCVAYAVSMFISEEFAFKAYKAALDRNKELGTHIAALKILPENCKLEINSITGHCSCWFFEQCDFEKIECLQIIPIHGNS